MRLTEYEQEMLAGAHGEPRRFAIDQQIKVGRFFDAEDFVAVSQVHLMADGEALGAAGLALLERFQAEGRIQSHFTINAAKYLARVNRMEQSDDISSGVIERGSVAKRLNLNMHCSSNYLRDNSCFLREL